MLTGPVPELGRAVLPPAIRGRPFAISSSIMFISIIVNIIVTIMFSMCY